MTHRTARLSKERSSQSPRASGPPFTARLQTKLQEVSETQSPNLTPRQEEGEEEIEAEVGAVEAVEVARPRK